MFPSYLFFISITVALVSVLVQLTYAIPTILVSHSNVQSVPWYHSYRHCPLTHIYYPHPSMVSTQDCNNLFASDGDKKLKTQKSASPSTLEIELSNSWQLLVISANNR